jgi:hypothetical protein
MGIVTVAASVVIVFHAATAEGGRSNLNPINLLRGANRHAHLTYARGAKMINNLRVVYEIQSRLMPQPDSLSEPLTPPPASRPSIEPQPGRPQSDEQREKSESVPHTGRRGGHNAPALAQMVPTPDRTSSSLFAASTSFSETRSIL